jgi:YebC/PmpR family DNA-binding regulatory protein
MSGHSKWATIKHQKAVNDQKRGQIFTKLGKAITLAAREGGGDEESNFKLRLAADKAKQANMPKANIERAIARGTGQGSEAILNEVLYEGYGPGNAALLVEAVTDNKNRTTAQVRKTFELLGGRLGEPGSVGFLFDKKGLILVKPKENEEEQILSLIDLGAEDVEKTEAGIEMVISPGALFETKKKLEAAGFQVLSAELSYIPKNLMVLPDKERLQLIKLLENLDDLDDVHNIHTNVDL